MYHVTVTAIRMPWTSRNCSPIKPSDILSEEYMTITRDALDALVANCRANLTQLTPEPQPDAAYFDWQFNSRYPAQRYDVNTTIFARPVSSGLGYRRFAATA